MHPFIKLFGSPSLRTICHAINLQLIGIASLVSLNADGPGDNQHEKVRQIPPPGNQISEQHKTSLSEALASFQGDLNLLRAASKTNLTVERFLPDVEIFHKAVDIPLRYNEFYNVTNEPVSAKAILAMGRERASQLLENRTPWNMATGNVVRAYRSKIDGSIQPYALVVPSSYGKDQPVRHRLDTWFHGRGETLTELNFITERLRSAGEFTPKNSFVLHLYGRYCNANKFAGEIDLFEALEDVKKHYPIDENRIVVRGFSMGGAACWQFATHYADLWVAAAPGAGFSETPDFLKIFQGEQVKPTWYETKLWRLYDCPGYALNLFHCPTVAYSGEVDKQKQAADIMAKAMSEHGMDLVHLIGPNTGHKYHPQTKQELNQRIDKLAELGRNPLPKSIRFQTYTLRYNKMFWVTLEAMDQHWEEARIEADIEDDRAITMKTLNASALSLNMDPGLSPFPPTRQVELRIDGQKLFVQGPRSDRSWAAKLAKVEGKWVSDQPKSSKELRKRHGLQGPIDDAFMDSFIMVTPSGRSNHAQIDSWRESEQSRAIEQWRRQFRGDARVVQDSEVTEKLIAESNLVLWGDATSNQIIKRIANQLPIKWNDSSIQVANRTFPSSTHSLILIYPNPLNPQKYIVFNSSFTFREYDYLNNARQIPKLPDYAVIDTRVASNARYPGKIVEAGFFNEQWQLIP